jgi:hypothetical protein
MRLYRTVPPCPKTGTVTFGLFNKTLPQPFADAATLFLARLGGRGVGAKRSGCQAQARHLALYHRDPFPYNGVNGTTTPLVRPYGWAFLW